MGSEIHRMHKLQFGVAFGAKKDVFEFLFDGQADLADTPILHVYNAYRAHVFHDCKVSFASKYCKL